MQKPFLGRMYKKSGEKYEQRENLFRLCKKNAVYEKICSIGATSPEYFELRDDEVIKTCGYDQNATIDSFYSSLTDSDFETIRLIMEPYVSEKK